MPRRRGSRASISSEQSTSSDHSENLNITDELPDPGLPKSNGKDAKEKKRVSFNFPVEVITKDGKYTGVGTINLMEASTSAQDNHSKPRKNKGECREIVYDLTQDEKKLEPAKNQEPPKNKALRKGQKVSKNQELPKKDVTEAVVETLKRNKKDAAKEALEAKKKETQARKEAIKKQVEEEKQAKAEFEEINKIFKPGECLKHINVEIHPTLATVWFMEDVKREVADMGVRLIEAEDICDPGVLMWTRFVPRTLGNEGGQVKLSPTKRQCDHALYITTAETLLTLIAEERASEHMTHKQELIGGKLTVVIYGVQNVVNLLGQTDKSSQERYSKAIADMQMELMVERKIELLLVDTPAELGMFVVHCTKAIAEAPFKKAKREIDEQAEFFMRGDNKNCVTVDKDGNGLSRLWEQMIAILPMSSLEVARSLGGEYKTPRALAQELQAVDGMGKIADIGVTRANVPGAKSRRVGKEFARKLHLLFTTEDGNAVIE